MKLLSKEGNQWDYYDAQVNAILEIKSCWWYKYIVDYRNLKAETAMQNLSNPKTPKELLAYYQAEYNTAIEFIDWLDNMS